MGAYLIRTAPAGLGRQSLHFQPLPVHAELKFVRPGQALYTCELRADVVVALTGEEVRYPGSPACTERESLNMVVLLQIGRDVVRF